MITIILDLAMFVINILLSVLIDAVIIPGLSSPTVAFALIEQQILLTAFIVVMTITDWLEWRKRCI